MTLRDDVKRYTQLFGPSGEEDIVIGTFVDDLRSLGYVPIIDPLGNVSVAVNEGDKGGRHVVISAHMDEIGFVIRKIEPDGFCYVYRVGGINDRIIAGQWVVFWTSKGQVEGHIGVKAKHVSSSEELGRAITVDECYVDFLVGNCEELEALGLTVGSLGTYVGPYREHGDFICAKALDNRVGVALLLEVARRFREIRVPSKVTLLATVQEEFSVRGGVPAARQLEPDLIFCLDIAIAADTPDLRSLSDLKLGAGPVITRFTRASLNGIIPNPKLRALVAEVAKDVGISVQYGVLQGGLTDGSFMQYEAGGIPTLDVSFATRYTHTAVETCSYRDVSHIADLLQATLQVLTSDTDLSRGVTARISVEPEPLNKNSG